MTSRPTMPSLAHIAAAWMNLPAADLKTTFPELPALAIGWGEPFCFRCGWLAPTRDTASYSHRWHGDRAFGLAWDAASGWLERGHLHDHDRGGSNAPLNFAPMCPLCHERQEPCDTREQGIAFVNELAEHGRLLWIVQLITDAKHAGQTNPGTNALRWLLRAYAHAGRIYADAIESAGGLPS